MTAQPNSWSDFVAFYQKLQGVPKPTIIYGRDIFWEDAPCLICGSFVGIEEVQGRYLVGGDADDETIPVANICGLCISAMEKDFEVWFE